MRLFFVLFLAVLLPWIAQAQNASSTASQTIQLVLHPTIDLQFTNSGNGNGSTINMAFNTMGQYSSGVISGTQELAVRSNKNFKISVQTDAATFAYTGNLAAGNPMPVNNTLFMAVTSNTTGGAVTSGFNNNYTTLSSSNQDLVLNGIQGEDKKLVVAYKAKPDLGYPAGTYSVGVIYTATQP